jgi:cyclopropane fatty-acyl-phospholipid synthase-like methyltransferase
MMGYIDSLIDARRAGHVSDHIHLGLFTDPSLTLDQAQTEMAAHHLAALDLRDGLDVVDVGCGFGGTLRMIDAQFAARLAGVNIDPRQIALAREGLWRNPVDWRTCDAATFSDGRAGWADRILSLEAMFHFPDPAAFFAACARALRPGGVLVVSTILLDDSPSAHAVAKGFAPWPLPEMVLEDQIGMAMAAGFKVQEIQNLAPLCLPGFDWMCPAPPPEITDNPVIELCRLFQSGAASYPMLVLQAGGNTQK